MVRSVTAPRRTDAVAAEAEYVAAEAEYVAGEAECVAAEAGYVAEGAEYKAAAVRVITWAGPRAGPWPAPARAPDGVRWPPPSRRRLRRMDSTPLVSPV